MKFILFVFLSLSAVSHSQTIELSQTDSKRFERLWNGLGNVLFKHGPSGSLSWFRGRAYRSTNGVFEFSCWTHFIDTKEGPTECEVNIRPTSQSDDDDDDEWTPLLEGNLVTITTDHSIVISDLAHNLKTALYPDLLFSTLEKGILLPTGGAPIKHPKLSIFCNDKTSGGTVRNCSVSALTN